MVDTAAVASRSCCSSGVVRRCYFRRRPAAASSACSPPDSPSSSASSSSSRSRTTTCRAAAPRPRRPSWHNSSRRRSSSRARRRADLSGELVCYARSVVEQRMASSWRRALAGDTINPWGVLLFRTLETIDPKTAAEQSAYDKWLEQTSTREAVSQRPDPRRRRGDPSPSLDRPLLHRGRDPRVHALLCRQRASAPSVQGLLIGSVVAVMVRLLLVIKSLDMPFHDGLGSIFSRSRWSVRFSIADAGACRDRPRRPCAVRRHRNPDELRRCPPFAHSRSSPPCCSPLRP